VAGVVWAVGDALHMRATEPPTRAAPMVSWP
jgi:hypothetical protein